MTPGRLQEIRNVFESLIELSPPEREQLLNQKKADDPALVIEVEQLVDAYEHRAGFIERPLANLKLFLTPDDREREGAGKVVGAYRLLQLIGEGGMGEVWRAEQKFPVSRIAAVKLIKAGMDTREVVSRFESERQALALMEHPAIAKVFDAGSTPEGRPYFVMEYVSGVPITSYCDEHRLTTRKRLELFVRVCGGVQHAHQKAIIHRDLKPSNILIAEVDGKPAPKIIDFGIAKAVSQAASDREAFTRVGAIMGTPDYMSPEQSHSAGEDLDTRTDVYSLGVILYELLAGALPFDSRRLGLHEVLRNLRESDTPPPSTRLLTQIRQPLMFYNRRTEPAALFRELRGDLDAIILKAVEKDRSRRYGSPSDLADDIERYLRNDPVIARPASVSYQVRKYIRRHRGAVGVAALLTALLVSFGIAEALQLRRITRERDRADRVTGFVTGMFNVSNPSENLGNKITAREILDKASGDIRTGLLNDPELQAQMMDVMGTVYYNLGLYPRAELLLRQALVIRRQTLGSEHPKTVESMNRLADTLNGEGRRTDAQKLYETAFEIRRRGLGPNDPGTLQSMNYLAVILVQQGRYREAVTLHRKILEIRRRILGPNHPDTLTSMDNLGNTLGDDGRYPEAEALEREALQIRRRILGPEHPQSLTALHHLADTLYEEGRYQEAEKLHREELDSCRRVLGSEHPNTLNAMIALANTLDDQKRYVDAEILDREAIDIQRRVLGKEHPDTLLAMSNLAGIFCDERRYAEAEEMQREVIGIRTAVLGPEHPHTLYSMSRLGWILILRGRFNEAERVSRETRTTQFRVLGPEHPDSADTTCTLASAAAHTGRTDEALSLLRNAVDHGLKPSEARGIEKDPRFESLRRDSRFGALVSYARRHAAVAQAANRH